MTIVDVVITVFAVAMGAFVGIGYGVLSALLRIAEALERARKP